MDIAVAGEPGPEAWIPRIQAQLSPTEEGVKRLYPFETDPSRSPLTLRWQQPQQIALMNSKIPYQLIPLHE
jgi:hypothetical protein